MKKPYEHLAAHVSDEHPQEWSAVQGALSEIDEDIRIAGEVNE